MYINFQKLLIIITFIASGLVSPPLAAQDRITGFSADDTLTIRSTEALMDELPDIVHFKGGFEIRASDWSLVSDNATLYGTLDDPETIVITGTPASILVNTVSHGQTSTISGQAERIVYQRDTNSIRMEGNASIARDTYSMNGSEIEYDIDRDHLSAGGTGGVQITILPDDWN
jgi:lipopolysaccharide transport protein LptA